MAKVCQHRADAERFADPSLRTLGLKEAHDVRLARAEPQTDNERDDEQRPKLCKERKKNARTATRNCHSEMRFESSGMRNRTANVAAKNIPISQPISVAESPIA